MSGPLHHTRAASGAVAVARARGRTADGRARALAVALTSIALAASALAAACGGGGSGGGAGGGLAAGSSAPAGGFADLVAVRRDALAPGADAALWLVARRPPGAAPASFAVEASANGITFVPVSAQPAQVSAEAVLFEVPLVGLETHYRIAAPYRSRAVRVPAAPPQGATLGIANPGQGASGVATQPFITAAGGAGAASFLYVLADARGEIVWLAESASRVAQPGAAGAAPLIDRGALARGAPYLASVIALDAEGFGFAWSKRVLFTAAP